MNSLFNYKFELNKENGTIMGTGVIEARLIGEEKKQVLDGLVKMSQIDGFRKGKAPKETVERSVNTLKLWSDAANNIFMQKFTEVLASVGHTPIDTPKLSFTSTVVGNDVEFKVSYTLMPEIKVDSKEDILKDVKLDVEGEIKVEESEIGAVLEDLKKSVYKHKNQKSQVVPSVLSDLTLEEIKLFSPATKSIESFKKTLKANLFTEKKMQAKMNRRERIAEAILKHTYVEVPQNLIKEEANRSLEMMKKQAEQLNTTIEEYLKTREVTEGNFAEELKIEAEKRVKLQFAISKLVAAMKITLSEDEVQKEVERFKTRVVDLDEKELRQYVYSVLLNEKLFVELENLYKSGTEK